MDECIQPPLWRPEVQGTEWTVGEDKQTHLSFSVLLHLSLFFLFSDACGCIVLTASGQVNQSINTMKQGENNRKRILMALIALKESIFIYLNALELIRLSLCMHANVYTCLRTGFERVEAFSECKNSRFSIHKCTKRIWRLIQDFVLVGVENHQKKHLDHHRALKSAEEPGWHTAVGDSGTANKCDGTAIASLN